jgi:hypothetical protein
MGLIKPHLKIAGDKGKDEVEALFDNGASASFVRWDIGEKIATIMKTPQPYTFKLGDGKNKLTVNYCTILSIDLKGNSAYHQVFVSKKLPRGLIIGADMMQRWKITLNLENEDFEVDKEAFELLFA